MCFCNKESRNFSKNCQGFQTTGGVFSQSSELHAFSNRRKISGNGWICFRNLKNFPENGRDFFENLRNFLSNGQACTNCVSQIRKKLSPLKLLFLINTVPHRRGIPVGTQFWFVNLNQLRLALQSKKSDLDFVLERFPSRSTEFPHTDRFSQT